MEWNFDCTNMPKDGSLLLLLVLANDDTNHTEETDDDLFRTIGTNTFDDTGEDEWRFAGWSWCHDEFVNETEGKIIAWMPFPEKPVDFPARTH